MTTLEGRIRDPDYRNWVKSTLCLQYTRDGLVTFTDGKSIELNHKIINQLRLKGNPSVHHLCLTIAFDYRRRSISCCRNCNDILNEVMQYRAGRLDLNLRNSDPTQLLKHHWQSTKLFMNPGQDVTSTGPKDTDISGLINFMDHCTVPRGYVNNPDLLKQVRDTRNRVLHTSSMKITEVDFQTVITPLLIDLLRDPGFLLIDPDAIAAVEKIREVKKADFIITKDNEKKVLDDLTNEIRRMNGLTNDEITKLTGQIDTLNKDVSALKCNNEKEFNDMRDDVKKNDRELLKVRHMCERLETLVEQSTDIQDEMRKQLKDIQEQTKSTNESNNALQLRVADMERRLSDMQEQIEEGRRQRDDLAEEQTKFKEGQTEDRQDIEVLYKRQNNISEEQTKLKGGQTEERQDINVLYKRHDNLSEEQTKLKEGQIEDRKYINVLNKRQDNLAKEQTKLKEGQTEDKKYINGLYKRQDNLSEEQTNLKESQIEDRKDINVLNKRQDNFGEEQTKLKEAQTEDRKDINGLYKRQNNLSEEQTKLKEGQIEDRKDINNLYEEQAKLKIDVDEVKGESQTRIPTEKDKSQLRQYLIDGYKDKLDMTLLPDWEPLQVSNIFTPAILICDREKETQEKEKFRNLGTYRELFYKNDVLQKRVILLGEAGAGKTTFSKHLTDLWCEPRTKQQFADVTVIKEFKYFFYVSCRFAKEGDIIADMIKDQIFGDDKLKDVATYMLEHYPECSLIVLDGADEWRGSPDSNTGRRGDIAGLPGMEGVEHCVILITSRPWRFHSLPTRSRSIFRRLHINGIKDVQVLADRILQKMEYPDPTKSSSEFLRQVRQNNMYELMETPLILIIALGGWVNDKSFHKSMCINYINMIQSFIRRSKGQAGWSSSKSKLQHLIPNLETLETGWETKANELPHLLLRYKSIRRYAGLCLLLGQLAFDLLLGKQEQSLVFSKQEFQSYLPADDENDESVNVCLALGILSKTETTTRGIRKLESYAFCHKTFQEFFAALWLASKYSKEISKLFKCVQKIRNLDSYEILITFLCEFDLEIGKLFWVDLAEEVEMKLKEEKDEREKKTMMKELQLFWVNLAEEVEMTLKEKKKKFQKLVCKHMKKHGFDPEDQTSVQVYFCIPHIVIDKYTSDEDIMLLYHVMEEYPYNVKSLSVDEVYSFRNKQHLSRQQALSICRSVSSCSGLQSLTINTLQSVSEERGSLSSLVLDLQKHDNLKTLVLRYLSIEGLLLPVEGARITSLKLWYVTMTHRSCEQLSESLSSCSHLEDLYLDTVKCREHRDSCCIPVIDLQKHDNLKTLALLFLSIESLLLPVEGARITSLTLNFVTMTHHGREQLSESLSSCSHLEDLDLTMVKCREHSDSCCIPVPDLQKHDKLKTLALRVISIEGLLLPVEGARITSLMLAWVTMSHHSCEQLSESLSSCSQLEDLSLDRVRCREHSDSFCLPVLDLQKHDKLKTLNLQEISIEDLLLPVEGARITSLTLVSVTISHHGLEQLSAAFSSRPELENWRPFNSWTQSLDKVQCREHSDSSCQTVKDITNFIKSHLK